LIDCGESRAVVGKTRPYQRIKGELVDFGGIDERGRGGFNRLIT
jgi:hypothetical protein